MEIINRNQFIWLESDIFIFPFSLLSFFMFPLIIKLSWDESQAKERLEKLFAVFQFDSFSLYLLTWIEVKRCSSFSKFSMSFSYLPNQNVQLIPLQFVTNNKNNVSYESKKILLLSMNVMLWYAAYDQMNFLMKYYKSVVLPNLQINIKRRIFT